MTRMSDKKESREERKRLAQKKVSEDIESVVLDFIAKKHLMFVEWEEKSVTKGGIDDLVIPRSVSRYSAGHRLEPFILGEVITPMEPVKLRKGVKLVLEDRILNFRDVVKSFKKSGKLSKIPLILTPKGYIYASAASAAMKKNMLVLKLTFGADGYLYSLKTFDYNWKWQSQAIWLRSIGMGQDAIAVRLKMSVNTIKAMLGRLKMIKYFKPDSLIDWATVGYSRYPGETPSGRRAVLTGGSSGLLYPKGKGFEAKFSIGEMTGAHRSGLLETEHFSIERRYPMYKPFSFKKHQEEVVIRNKEEIKRRNQMTLEQKTIEIENLKKNIEKGFDSETGTYKEEDE